jgi:parallel beta-helix repeat protein
MDVTGESTLAGAFIQQWTCNGNVPQQKFAKAAVSTVAPAPAPTPAPAPAPSPAPTTGGTAGPTITTFTPSGPITLTSGMTVTGKAISNPNGPCISGSGVSNVHIFNNKIGPCAAGELGVGILIQSGSHDVTVDHNSFSDVATGLYVVTSTNNIVFDHNFSTLIRGPMPRGQMVQFNGVNGSGNRISCNVDDETSPVAKGSLEDHFNMYNSFGTAASPILIQYNKVRGGGPSQSGGGMLSGDSGSSYVTIDSNIAVNPGQYGIAIAGGHNNRLLNNKVYSASFPWANIGMDVWLWNPAEPACFSHEVSGNRVNFTNRDGVANNWWDGGNCGAITMSSNVFGDPTITANIWNDPIPQCG